MRMTALQLPARWNQVAAQLAYVETVLEGGPKTDLVLLPEASLTGYVSPGRDFDLTRFAEQLDGPTRDAYAHLAKRFDCLMVGPLIERDGERVFNSLIGVTPDGETLLHYRKKHPWMPETWASAGESWCPTVQWRGVAVTAAICFDLHFLLEEPRVDAELLLFASAWVGDSRAELLSALAKKNGFAVLNANWGAGEVRVTGQGESMHVAADGEVRARIVDGAARLDIELPLPAPAGRGLGRGATK